MRTPGIKWPWRMQTGTKQKATNVIRPTTKETNAHTKRKVGATEIKVAKTRIAEGQGNPGEIHKKKTAERNKQN